MKIDPERDLVIERLLMAPPSLVWRCWTEPDLFRQWYAPKPMQLTAVELELRAGGRFFMEMTGPDGQRMPNEGSFLVVEPESKIVFTDLMTQDFSPVEKVSDDFGPAFTAVISFAPEGTGTRYRAVARHASAREAKINLDMGFEQGWGIQAAQLEALLAKMEETDDRAIQP
ncbi:SRPBCC family protein [Tabrizicola sp. J26]|uniref:SRPBCC family protein n=1 Tax=Alitabrizicola rongguiensis TaxID=2909234 RepID=UPI001F245C60|nr:SRPBCC family protein [Tabrizicola rongguiensis]MCF1707235.1 SRPBCC family protein [Tabrizicola rongguiensis]